MVKQVHSRSMITMVIIGNLEISITPWRLRQVVTQIIGDLKLNDNQ